MSSVPERRPASRRLPDPPLPSVLLCHKDISSVPITAQSTLLLVYATHKSIFVESYTVKPARALYLG